MEFSYFEAFAAGLFLVFTWPTFGYMLIGIVIGFAVGTWLTVWILQYQLHIPFPKPALLQLLGITAPFWV